MARRTLAAASASGRVFVLRWTLFPARALAENGFEAIAGLLLHRRRDEPVDAKELAVAYDFLCDLAVETSREDVERAIAFLGRCQAIGIGLALAELATEVHRSSLVLDMTNRRVRRALDRGDLERAADLTLDGWIRWEERSAAPATVRGRTARRRLRRNGASTANS